jgi:signal peptidase I
VFRSPGDTVEIRDRVLYLNGVAAEYRVHGLVNEHLEAGVTIDALHATEQIAGIAHAVQFFPANDLTRSFTPRVVPADHYFMLGDSRDNSRDSRFIGFVHRDRLIGRAHRILVSADITSRWQPRWERIVSRIR